MKAALWRGRLAAWAVAMVLGGGAVRGEGPLWVEARALVEPSHDIEVVSATPGVIQKVLVKEGQKVTAGQPLIQLDAEAQKAVLALSEHQAKSTARVESAEANLRVKRVAHQRQLTLFKKGVASEADLQEAELELKYADSLLVVSREEQALHQLEVHRDRVLLDRMTIQAPVAGIVRRRLRDVGEAAEEGQPLLQLVVLDVLHVIAHVPTADSSRLRPGMPATLFLDAAPERGHPCKVLVVDPVIDAASSSRRVKLELANHNHAVIAGSRGVVRFDLSETGRAAGPPPAGPERRP